MESDDTPPQSVFNTQNAAMVRFLESQQVKNRNGEDILLYPHQVEAVLRVREYFENPNLDRKIALVVLPTGCGKTGVAVLASYALDASRVLVITPSVIISTQIHDAYRNFLIDRGIIPNTPKDVQNKLPSVSLIKKSSEIEAGTSSTVMVVNAHKIGGQSNVQIKDIPQDGYDLVIVDEAHHYPAPTWKKLVDYFCNSRRLFLTATPEHGGKQIMYEIGIPILPCYELKRNEAIARGIIRNVKFDETSQGVNEKNRFEVIASLMERYRKEHDQDYPSVKHQGMVLAQTLNQAELFCDTYNELFPDTCKMYVTESSRNILDDFNRGQVHVLVIIGRLLEGFDRKHVSVLGIIRNIAPTSRVLFAQFVGRAVRKNDPGDLVSAQIVTHVCFNQHQNYLTFEKMAEEDPTDVYN